MAQQLIPGTRAEAVVGQAEAIQVHREDADRPAAALAAGERQVQVLDELGLVGQAGDLVVVAVLEVRAKQRLGEHPDGEKEPAGDQRACGMGERPGRVDRHRVGDQDGTQEEHPRPDRHAIEARHQGDDRDRQPGQRRAARAAGDGDADS